MNTQGKHHQYNNSKETGREAVRGSGVSWKHENRRAVFILEEKATDKLSPPERQEAAGKRDWRRLWRKLKCWQTLTTLHTQDLDWVKGTITDSIASDWAWATSWRLLTGGQERERKRQNVIPQSQEASWPETLDRRGETQDRDSRVQDGMLIQEQVKGYCEGWGGREERSTRKIKDTVYTVEWDKSKAETARERFKATQESGCPAFFQQGLSCSFAVVVVIWEMWDKRRENIFLV